MRFGRFVRRRRTPPYPQIISSREPTNSFHTITACSLRTLRKTWDTVSFPPFI